MHTRGTRVEHEHERVHLATFSSRESVPHSQIVLARNYLIISKRMSAHILQQTKKKRFHSACLIMEILKGKTELITCHLHLQRKYHIFIHLMQLEQDQEYFTRLIKSGWYSLGCKISSLRPNTTHIIMCACVCVFLYL